MATSTVTPILPPEPPPLQDNEMSGTHSLLISLSQNLSSPYLKTSHPPVLKQHQRLFATFHKRKKTELLSTVVGSPRIANCIVMRMNLFQLLCQVLQTPMQIDSERARESERAWERERERERARESERVSEPERNAPEPIPDAVSGTSPVPQLNSPLFNHSLWS